MTARNLLDLKGGKMKKGYPLFVLILIGLIFIGCAKVKFAPHGQDLSTLRRIGKNIQESATGYRIRGNRVGNR